MSIDLDATYRRYAPMVRRRCLVLLGDEEQAMDAMQDVFVQLIRRGEHLNMLSPASFLYRAATNTCLNRLRSRRRKPLVPDSELLDRIACAPDVERLAVARSSLRRLFREEPESTRTMAVMHLLDGMTLEEVACAVEMSVSGVRRRLRLLKRHVPELEGVD